MAENQTTALTPAQMAVTSFKRIVDGNYFQAQIKKALGNNAGTFTSSLMEVFTNDKSLQGCDPKAVAQEAIKACCMHLPLNKALGYAYILPFKNKGVPTPTLVLGFKGIIQLAYRSNQYKYINADVVYEGELLGKNKLSGELDLSGERTGDTVEGFFAHFEMKNGGCHTLYMSAKEMAHYAKIYSPTLKFDKITEDELYNLMQTQAVSGPAGGVGWKNDVITMSIKTVLRRLLTKWGYLSIEMATALNEDEMPSPEQQRDEVNNEPKQSFDAAQYAKQTAEDATYTEVEDNPFAQ